MGHSGEGALLAPRGSWLGASSGSLFPLHVPSRVIWYIPSRRFREPRLPCWCSERTQNGHGATPPDKPTRTVLSGHQGTCINGEALRPALPRGRGTTWTF